MRILVLLAALLFTGAARAEEGITFLNENALGAADARILRIVRIPDEDRFLPFAISIRPGDVVEWRNHDDENHTITSADGSTSPPFRGVNVLIPRRGPFGLPGRLLLRFNIPGVFIYYCQFHSHLDRFGQPVAHGDIPGTPMMGVITVLP